MHPPWLTILTALSEITSKKYTSIICCPSCGNRHCFVRFGFYSRYLFDGELTQIQRYRCDNDQCPQSTFSILPHAFLRIARASLCMFMHVLQMYEQGESVAAIARYTDSNWPRIKDGSAKLKKLKIGLILSGNYLILACHPRMSGLFLYGIFPTFFTLGDMASSPSTQNVYSYKSRGLIMISPLN